MNYRTVISWGVAHSLLVIIAAMAAIPALRNAGNQLGQETNDIDLGPFVLNVGMVGL
jgi:hypothetical protein